MSYRSSAIAAAALLAAAACHATVDPARPAGSLVEGRLSPLARLRHELDAVLADPALAHGTWGVLAKSLRNGETLYSLNPQKLLIPASNMKIVTLAAAAERLGWDFTYETRVVVVGPIVSGTLTGDLVVVGSGDPSVVVADGSADRVFGEWATRLQQLGIRAIDGRLVGDDHAFESDTLGFGWSWDDLPDDYAAGVGALQFNENGVRVTVGPGPTPGDAAAVSLDPPDGGINVTCAVRTTAAGGTTSLSAHRLPGRQRLEIRGSIAAGTAPAVLAVSVDDPTRFFVQALRRALIARGIDVRGPAVVIDDLLVKPDMAQAVLVNSHRSPPLSTLAVRLMKASQNQYAETFLKTLGAATAEPPRGASALAGQTTAQTLLEGWGVGRDELIQRDGSGLTRYDYVSAQALVTILSHVYNDEKLRGPFEASLPVAGDDGTLARRMKGTPAEGRARAKTGSMSNVRTLSGYVNTVGDEPLVFSILANNFGTPPDLIEKATDAIVVALAGFRR